MHCRLKAQEGLMDEGQTAYFISFPFPHMTEPNNRNSSKDWDRTQNIYFPHCWFHSRLDRDFLLLDKEPVQLPGTGLHLQMNEWLYKLKPTRNRDKRHCRLVTFPVHTPRHERHSFTPSSSFSSFFLNLRSPFYFFPSLRSILFPFPPSLPPHRHGTLQTSPLTQ